MLRVVTAAAAVCLLAGCAGEAVEPSAEVSPTLPAESASPEATVPAGVFLKGYPKVVKMRTLPESVSGFLIGIEKVPQSTTMIAVAPGVWTERVRGMSVTQNALDGSAVGLCAGVRAQDQRRDAAGLQPRARWCK